MNNRTLIEFDALIKLDRGIVTIENAHHFAAAKFFELTGNAATAPFFATFDSSRFTFVTKRRDSISHLDVIITEANMGLTI